MFFHDPDVAPECELHSTGDGRSRDRCDDRLGQRQSSRSQWPTRNRIEVYGVPLWKRQLALEVGGGKASYELQIPAGAECSAFAPQDRHVSVIVGLKGEKRIH